MAFVRVPASSFSSARPEGWGVQLGKKVPDQETCWASWGELAKEVLVSSEAEKPKATAPATSSKKVSGLQEDLANLSQMEDPSSSDSESGSEVLAAKRSKNKSGHLPPGGQRGAASSSQSRQPSDRPKDPDMAKVVKKLMMKGMTKGQSPSELLPYMMMSMMLDQKEKSKHRRRGRRDRDSPGVLLRKFGIRRQRPQVRDACCDIPSQAPEEDHSSPKVHTEGFQAAGGRRSGCGGGTVLDADGLCEASAVGQLSFAGFTLRTPHRRSNRGRPGPVGPEPQGEDPERDSRWQL